MRRQRWVASRVCTAVLMPFFFFAGSPTLLLSFESLSFWTILKADWELLEVAMVQELITVPLLGIFFLIEMEENVQRFHNFPVVTGEICMPVQKPPLWTLGRQSCSVQSPQLSSSLRYSSLPADRFHPASNVCKRCIPHPRLLPRLFY